MTLAKPHFSFWIFAAVGLLWNLMGCLNYIMQANADVVAQMPELYQAIIAARPAWATAAFAIAVFGGAAGVTPSLVLVVLVGVALLWYTSIARRSGWLG